MEKSFINKIFYEFQGLCFLIRNLYASRNLLSMRELSFSNYRLTGLPKSRLNELDTLHKLVREGRELSFWRKTYYKLCGKKVCSILINKENKMVGFNIFYFRDFEIKNGIIHNAFIGVTPIESHKGLGTILQTYSLEQLSRNNLTGVSGYVLKNNQASIKMLQKVGFTLTEDANVTANYNIFYSFREK
jgi:ribosomal protein S18 acetylase RimI-like enzyme